VALVIIWRAWRPTQTAYLRVSPLSGVSDTRPEGRCFIGHSERTWRRALVTCPAYPTHPISYHNRRLQ